MRCLDLSKDRGKKRAKEIKEDLDKAIYKIKEFFKDLTESNFNDFCTIDQREYRLKNNITSIINNITHYLSLKQHLDQQEKEVQRAILNLRKQSTLDITVTQKSLLAFKKQLATIRITEPTREVKEKVAQAKKEMKQRIEEQRIENLRKATNMLKQYFFFHPAIDYKKNKLNPKCVENIKTVDRYLTKK